MPQNLFYVCPPRKAYAIFEKVKEEARETHEVPFELLRSGLNYAQYVMSAFQCDPFYLTMAKRQISAADLPIKMMDFSGPTYRNEGTNCEGLYRLNEFHRMELTWLADADTVNDLQTKTRELAEEIINQLDLDW